MSIDELIPLLVATVEPDPHLDAEIEAVLRGGEPAYRSASRHQFGPSVVLNHGAGNPWDGWESAPSFTGSLDAALTLVPERHRWLLDKRPGAYFRSDGYRAEVYREAHHYQSDRSDVPMHWGPTPALAICVAALKARQAYPQTVIGDDATTQNTES